MNEQYPFELAPLPYAYDALEPYIDTRTVTVHHDRHQAGYVKKLNEALREFPIPRLSSSSSSSAATGFPSGSAPTCCATRAASGRTSFISTA
ncbi:MAG: hypothetical protein ACLVL7_07930 [Anaerotruncus massiliensis (ex Togo et al. 2019)]